jgi:hypothetical protein
LEFEQVLGVGRLLRGSAGSDCGLDLLQPALMDQVIFLAGATT